MTLCSRGLTKLLAQSRKMPLAAILFFQNEAKNIPRQNFMDMNISCKFEKSTYYSLASRGVTRKSLHTAVAAYSCVIYSIASGESQKKVHQSRSHVAFYKVKKMFQKYLYHTRSSRTAYVLNFLFKPFIFLSSAPPQHT